MGNQIRGRKHLTVGLLTLALGFWMQCTAYGQTIIPGYRSPLVTTLPTPAQFRSHLGGGSGAGQSQVSNEIKELARALKYDPALMYKFVHDYIDYELAWGDIKGSHMTWMDRSGNAFDQASLMIDLLLEAQAYNQANSGPPITNINYVVGEIQLTSQIYEWLGMDYYTDAIMEEALARAGLYGNKDSNGLRLMHVWVKVTIDGQNYEFDPSFKSHSHSIGMFSMNNYLEGAMGYDSSSFAASAMAGSDSGLGWIKDVNKTNIQSNLNTYASNLTDEVEDEAVFGEITLKDVIGGKTITAVAETATLPTTMPYTIISRDNTFAKSSVPYIYRTTLNLQYNGINKTFYSSDIYGRALTLSFNGSNQPVLTLDDIPIGNPGNACTPGTAYNLVFTVDHPDEANSFAKTSTLPVIAGGFYSILNGWGQTGTHVLARYRQSLNTEIDKGSALNSEEVLGRAYTLAGLSWMAQASKMRAMASQIKSGSLPHRVFHQHVLGVAGQDTIPYLAIADNTYTIANQNSQDNLIEALFFAIADYSSLYQEKIIQQLQGDTGISAISALTMGNDRTTVNKTFSLYNTNVEAELQGYSQAEKDLVSAYATAGYGIAFPQYGDLSSGSFTYGMGLDARKISSTELTSVHLITGSHGAVSTSSTTMDVSELVTLTDTGVYKQQDGVETAGSADLSIGSGSLPFGLTFSRSYSSVNRFNDGPLGKGWTHNFDISIKVLSDSFKALESGSVYDQIPQIVGLYVSFDSYCSSTTWNLTNLMSKLTSSWLGDALTDNKILVKQGAGGFSFGKAVDGSYNPPVGTNMKLTTETDGSYRLRDTSGKFYDFDTAGRMEQWSDAHGNKVVWTYSNNKLASVTTKIGGTDPSWSMSFTQPGDHISKITDSAGREIEYHYDTHGQLTRHTNPDGHDVTYAYDTNLTGLLTQVFSPDNPTTAVNTTVYDTLGRVKQKTNAVGSTWDYYLAYYRAETELPAQLDPNDPTNVTMTRYCSSVWLDKYGQPISAKDIMGRETSYAFDGIYRPTQVVGSSGMSTQYQYNADNQVTSVISSAVSGSGYADLEAVFGYNTYQNSEGRYFIKSNYTEDPTGNETIYEYDFDNIAVHLTDVGNLMNGFIRDTDY